jgi:uncharacterized protein (DUF427 family)
MSLTSGRGPLSEQPTGRFVPALPDGTVYVEPFPRRVRAMIDGAAVIDCQRVLLVHRAGGPPTYAFPADEVADIGCTPEPAADGYVAVDWAAADAWYEEDQLVRLHASNPYHRIQCLRTSRRLQVHLGDTQLVDTTDTVVVYETALVPRLYVAREHVRMDLLEPSATTTFCPSKGAASYWSTRAVRDVAWSYDDPLPESLPVAGLLSFDEQRVTMIADLPET